MSDIFLLFCIFSLKQRTSEARKTVFYFTSKAPSFLRYSNFRKSEPKISCYKMKPNHMKQKIHLNEQL